MRHRRRDSEIESFLIRSGALAKLTEDETGHFGKAGAFEGKVVFLELWEVLSILA